MTRDPQSWPQKGGLKTCPQKGCPNTGSLARPTHRLSVPIKYWHAQGCCVLSSSGFCVLPALPSPSSSCPPFGRIPLFSLLGTLSLSCHPKSKTPSKNLPGRVAWPHQKSPSNAQLQSTNKRKADRWPLLRIVFPQRQDVVYTKPRPQGQLGKAWRQLRAPPPVFVGPDQWNEALTNFTAHERQEGPPSPRGHRSRKLDSHSPGVRSSSRSTKLQMREVGRLKQFRAASTTPLETSFFAVDTRPGHRHWGTRTAERAMAHTPPGMLRQGGWGHPTYPDWHALVQAVEPSALETSQVRLGSLSPR